MISAPLAPDASAARNLLDLMLSRPPAGKPRQVDKPLVIYGAGDLGRMAKTYFDRLHISVSAVVDANPEMAQKDPFWHDIPLVSPAEFSSDRKAQSLTAVCVVKTAYSTLQTTLRQNGWGDVVPFYDIAEAYRDRHPLSNGWFSGALSSNEQSRTEKVISLWGDNISRAHHLQFLAWHYLREDWTFANADVSVDDRYLIPQIAAFLNDKESFLDVGAHHGEVIPRFLAATGNRYAEITAIEADDESFGYLSRYLQSLTGPNRGIKIAVSDREGDCAFFPGLGYASQLSSLSNTHIKVTTLDHLDLAPTFVKLHLEGWELAAITGGMQMLRTHRPMLVTTAYHNRQGIAELPEYLMDNLPDYSFLARLHSWCGTGLVVYAIPKERYLSERATHAKQ